MRQLQRSTANVERLSPSSYAPASRTPTRSPTARTNLPRYHRPVGDDHEAVPGLRFPDCDRRASRGMRPNALDRNGRRARLRGPGGNAVQGRHRSAAERLVRDARWHAEPELGHAAQLEHGAAALLTAEGTLAQSVSSP